MYHDAEVSKFIVNIHDDQAELSYNSSRPFSYLAEGLLLGCIEYFGENISLERLQSSANDAEYQVKFILKRSLAVA